MDYLRQVQIFGGFCSPCAIADSYIRFPLLFYARARLLQELSLKIGGRSDLFPHLFQFGCLHICDSSDLSLSRIVSAGIEATRT